MAGGEEFPHSVFLREDVLGFHPVDPGYLAFLADVLPSGFQHVHPIHPVVERVEAELGFVLRFLI